MQTMKANTYAEFINELKPKSNGYNYDDEKNNNKYNDMDIKTNAFEELTNAPRAKDNYYNDDNDNNNNNNGVNGINNNNINTIAYTFKEFQNEFGGKDKYYDDGNVHENNFGDSQNSDINLNLKANTYKEFRNGLQSSENNNAIIPSETTQPWNQMNSGQTEQTLNAFMPNDKDKVDVGGNEHLLSTDNKLDLPNYANIYTTLGKSQFFPTVYRKLLPHAIITNSQLQSRVK